MKNFLIILYVSLTIALTNSGAAAVPATPLAATTTIMVFGDSLSAGYGLPQDAGWVSLLKRRLQTQQAHLINTSISGETASGGRKRIEQALKTHRPNIVILELGGNDGLRGASIQSISDDLEAIIEACQRNKATVLLAGMQLPPNYGIAYTQKFQDIYPQLAKRHGLKLVPFLLDGFGHKREFFQADGIHPTAHAQERIEENVWKVLRTMLKSQGAVAQGNTREYLTTLY